MLKKFFNRLKKNPDSKQDEAVIENVIPQIDEICITEEIIIKEEKIEIIKDLNVHNLEECIESNIEEEINDYCIEDSEEETIEEDDEEYIKNIKIVRGKSIRAIDVYTEEELVFKTHKECSRKLKLPIGYIIENLKYGYTDYLGEAINYLSKELQTSEEFNYLESNKTPLELFNNLNNKIFTARISEIKREEILSSEKIEPIKMHYRFECIDEEYDEYFEKYKSIIKRGGKKKIELVDKNGEVIEIFKSLDECASYLGKDKNEVVEMLKYKNTKVGRNKIRYSLRNI